MNFREQMTRNNIAVLIGIIAFLAIVLAVIGYSIRVVTPPPSLKLSETVIGTILSKDTSKISSIEIVNKEDQIRLYNQSMWQMAEISQDDSLTVEDYHQIYVAFEKNYTDISSFEQDWDNTASTTEADAKRIENSALPRNEVSGEQCVWNILQPHLSFYSKEKGKQLVNSLLNLDYYSIIIPANKQDLAAYGLLEPLATVTYEYSDGREESLKIGYAKEDNPTLYYAQLVGSNVVYVVGNKIKSAFNNRLALVNLQLTNNLTDLSKKLQFISLYRSEDQLYLDFIRSDYLNSSQSKVFFTGEFAKKEPLKWYLFRPFWYLANQNYLNSFINYLAQIEAYACVDKISGKNYKAEAQLTYYGLDKPAYELTLGDIDKNLVECKIGRSIDKKNYYLKLANRPYIYLVDHQLVDFLQADKNYFVQKQPLNLNFNNLAAITYVQDKDFVQISNAAAMQNTDLLNNSYNYLLDQAVEYINDKTYNAIKNYSVRPEAPSNMLTSAVFNWLNYLLPKETKKDELNQLNKSNFPIPKISNDKLFIFAQTAEKIRYINTKIMPAIEYTCDFQAEAEAAKRENKESNGKALTNKLNQLLTILQNSTFNNIAWEAAYQIPTVKPTVSIALIYKNGTILNFDFYEVNKGSYYLYINDVFTHLVIKDSAFKQNIKSNNALQRVDFNDLMQDLISYCKH